MNLKVYIIFQSITEVRERVEVEVFKASETRQIIALSRGYDNNLSSLHK